MTRAPWWIPVLATGVAHAAFLAVPLHFDEPPQRTERPLVLRFKTPEPPEPEPEPEPEPVLHEPEPEPPPPEPVEEPEPPPPEPEPKPEPNHEPPPSPEPAEPEPVEPEPAPAAPPPVHAEPAPSPEPTVPTTPKARVEPTPPAPEKPAPGPSKADFTAYAQGMRAAFLRHRRYPPAALRARLEGVTKVKLAVDQRGKLVGTPTVVRSSGHPILDEEALRVVTVAAPFDPLPLGTPKDVMTFVIPIDFRLAGR